MSAPAASSPASPPTEHLAGLVERVTFHNEENGSNVLRLKARGQRDLITIIGHAATISAGEFVQATGSWTTDRTHGPQFRASLLRATPPTTTEGIERYLGSGMIRGIGPTYAKRLVRTFGDTVFDVIESDPARLRDVEGIGPVRAARIAAGWAEQKVVREIMLFLHAHGVSASRAVRIYKTYGAEAVAVITENPYRLARDIRGIGFKTADQIAAKLGIAKDAAVRVRAGVSFVLAEALDDGHCGLPEDDLLRNGAALLEVAAERLTAALALELQDGAVVADIVGERRCIFLAGLHRAERDIAERLRILAAGQAPWPFIDPARAIPDPSSAAAPPWRRASATPYSSPRRAGRWSLRAAPASARRRWSTPSSRSSRRRASTSCSARPPAAPPSASKRRRAPRRRPSAAMLTSSRIGRLSIPRLRLRSAATL